MRLLKKQPVSPLGQRQQCLRGALCYCERDVSKRGLQSPPQSRQARCIRLKAAKGQRAVAVRSQVEEAKSIETEVDAEDPSVYFEPFLRSFVLGISAGAVCELIHVGSKFFNLIRDIPLGDLAQRWPELSEHFAPVIVDDHMVAIGSWLLFYAIEACAVMKVLDKHAQNPAAAAKALKTLTTLPRLMLPRLTVFKHVLRVFGIGRFTGAAFASLGADIAAPRIRTTSSGGLFTAPKPGPAPPLLDPAQEPEGPPPEPEGSEEEPKEAPRKPLTPLEGARARLGLRPGQLDTSTSEFLHRQNELNGRRSYLQNFWYAVGISEKVKDKPVGVEILGEKVVLYRDSQGRIQCLHDVCPHRGAPLHLGWKSEVQGHDCLVCPYHGWAFDGDGRLRDVPASENAHDWPKKPLVHAFPVKEKGGFIWLFYGSKALPEDERPPIPYVPELDDGHWRPVYGEIEFNCSHWSVFENAIDMAHIHYLHADSFGNDAKPQIRDMTCTTNAYGVEASFALHNKPVNAMWEFAKVPEVKVTAKAYLPSTSVIGFTLGQGLSFITFVNTVPISANRTINRFALIRRLDVDRVGSFVFNLSAWDSAARSAMIKILTEDKAMVEKLMPEMLGREISVKADLPQMAFRKLRQQYIDMGYGVTPENTTHPTLPAADQQDM